VSPLSFARAAPRAYAAGSPPPVSEHYAHSNWGRGRETFYITPATRMLPAHPRYAAHSRVPDLFAPDVPQSVLRIAPVYPVVARGGYRHSSTHGAHRIVIFFFFFLLRRTEEGAGRRVWVTPFNNDRIASSLSPRHQYSLQSSTQHTPIRVT
jgi:hypothetical protein